MTQARQIFVYARAESRGWHEGAGVIARAAFAAMVERYFEPDARPGWVFSCDAAGRVVDSRRDFYGQAFCLLACAEHAMLSGDAAALDLADRTLAFMDAEMASSHGGYNECWPEAVLPRRQNPHMHLMESLLALHDADPRRGYLARAARLVELLDARFLLAKGRCLGEFFEQDWTPRNPHTAFEPGHHFEWIWLLYRFDQAGGGDMAARRQTLLEAAVTGFRDDGLLVDEMSVLGEIVGPATRLWPLTEAMKALTLPQATAIRAPSPADCWAALHFRFLSGAQKGCWQDYFSTDGSQLVDFIPASSLYHIVCAFDFLVGLDKGNPDAVGFLTSE
jgi:mannose-6-phosphate isomerase